MILTIYGCGNIKKSNKIASNNQPSQYTYPKNITTSELKPSLNFSNNSGIDRAYFGLGTDNCTGNGLPSGIYVVAINQNSVAKKKGLSQGDRIVQIGAHKPKNSKELTNIIQHLTPDVVYTIGYYRLNNYNEILVIPPAWIPSQQQQEKINSPYKEDFDLCKNIGLTRYSTN